MSAIRAQTRSLFRAYARATRSLVDSAVRRKAMANVREAFCVGHALDLCDSVQKSEAESLLSNGEQMLPVWQRVAAAPAEAQALFGRKPSDETSTK